MILSLKKNLAPGKPSSFKERILAGVGIGPLAGHPKIHCMVEGDRWYARASIEMVLAYHSRGQEVINKDHKELRRCKSVQKIEIRWHHITKGDDFMPAWVKVDGQTMEVEHIMALATNEGFDHVDDFFNFYNRDFKGQIVHWTDFKYVL